jgi:uncharacterized protein YbjQ (UPF0145 family)
MEEFDICPNCQAQLKSGLISSTRILNRQEVELINEYHDSKSDVYCSKCGSKLYKEYCAKLKNEKNDQVEIIKKLINEIPVISTHSPLNWDYTILGMVTGQSTIGTGVITEISSSFTDFFGEESGRHNKKIKEGEQKCYLQLRKQVLDLGGNAVIATDIDYSELGSFKGMIMVCMAGTAVKLNNPEILGVEKSRLIKELVLVNERLNYLNKFRV